MSTPLPTKPSRTPAKTYVEAPGHQTAPMKLTTGAVFAEHDLRPETPWSMTRFHQSRAVDSAFAEVHRRFAPAANPALEEHELATLIDG